MPSSALDALEHEVQGLLDDLHDDGKWNEYDTDTARLVWHATVVKAARTIEAMGGQFGGAFDRIQAITYANVWRAWNTGPIVSLAATS
ncbi:hypothetical protein CFB47_39300 [Burkholderia sp. AU27893]|nr:hypothetical protein CFB47_39300 [Burkholderia sp. AU27893]